MLKGDRSPVSTLGLLVFAHGLSFVKSKSHKVIEQERATESKREREQQRAREREQEKRASKREGGRESKREGEREREKERERVTVSRHPATPTPLAAASVRISRSWVKTPGVSDVRSVHRALQGSGLCPSGRLPWGGKPGPPLAATCAEAVMRGQQLHPSRAAPRSPNSGFLGRGLRGRRRLADVPVITQLEFQHFVSYENLEGGKSVFRRLSRLFSRSSGLSRS